MPRHFATGKAGRPDLPHLQSVPSPERTGQTTMISSDQHFLCVECPADTELGKQEHTGEALLLHLAEDHDYPCIRRCPFCGLLTAERGLTTHVSRHFVLEDDPVPCPWCVQTTTQKTRILARRQSLSSSSAAITRGLHTLRRCPVMKSQLQPRVAVAQQQSARWRQT